MNSYDDYLDKITNEYLEGCVNYKNEIVKEEHCLNCDIYCDNYLDTLNNEEIKNELIELQEEFSYFLPTYIFEKLTNKIELLKSYLKGENNER